MMDSKNSTLKISSLKKRSDFSRLRNGKFARRPAFLLQAARSTHEQTLTPEQTPTPGQIRVGFTCSKKIGNAVARNKAKRRLREIARIVLPEFGQSDWDYVFIGRNETSAKRDFAKIKREAQAALSEIHGSQI